jgi:hypothetical protein
MYPIILTQPHGQARNPIVGKRSHCAHVPYDDRVLGTMDMIINNNGTYIQWSPTSRYVYIIWYRNCVFTKFTSIFRCTLGIYWQDFLYTRTPEFTYIINYFQTLIKHETPRMYILFRRMSHLGKSLISALHRVQFGAILLHKYMCFMIIFQFCHSNQKLRLVLIWHEPITIT